MIDSAMLVRIAAQIDEPTPTIELARAIWTEAFNAGLEAAAAVAGDYIEYGMPAFRDEIKALEKK